MEDLKKYESLLEDLGEESNQYDKIIRKTQELKNQPYDEEIEAEDVEETLPNEEEEEELESLSLDEIEDAGSSFLDAEEENLDALEEEESFESFGDEGYTIDEIEKLKDTQNDKKEEDVEEAEDFYAAEEYSDSSNENEFEFYSDADEIKEAGSFGKENFVYRPTSEDELIDRIFANLDTREYREKREEGLFEPKFKEDDFVYENEHEEDDEVGEELFEDLFKAPKELEELAKDMEEIDHFQDEEDDLDSLLSEYKDEYNIVDETEDEAESVEELEEIGEEDFSGSLESENEDLNFNEDIQFDTLNEDSLPVFENEDAIDFGSLDNKDEMSLDGTLEETLPLFEDDSLKEELPLDEITGGELPLEESLTLGNDEDFNFDFQGENLEDLKNEEPEFHFEDEQLGEEKIPDFHEENNLTEEPLISLEEINLDEEIPDEGELIDFNEQDEEIKPLEEKREEAEDIHHAEEIEESSEPVFMSNDLLSEEEVEKIDYENWEKDLKEADEEDIHDRIKDNQKSNSQESQYQFEEDEESFQDEEINDFSEKDLQRIQYNLNKLPPDFAIYLKKLLMDPKGSNQIKGLVSQELMKEYPNLFRLKAVSGFQDEGEKEEKKNLMPLLKILSFFFIGAVVTALLWFMLLKPYFDNKNLLEAGLVDIGKGNFVSGNDKFNQADPSLKWYNAYAEKFMDMEGGFPFAEEKLIGKENILNPSAKRKAAVFIDPEDERTRLNIAELYRIQRRYEKVLEDDSDPLLQYDDSLFYLYHKNPERFDLADKIGQAYIEWGNYLKKVPLKNEKLKKAYEIYFDYWQKHPEEIPPLSRMLYVMSDMGENIDKQMEYVANKGLLSQLDHKALSQIALYYIKQERFKPVYDIISILNSQNTEEPLAYYMMGDYHIRAEDMNLALTSLIKGYHFNGVYKDKNKTERIRNIDNTLQSKIDSRQGEVYLKLANEYSGVNQFNKEKKDKFLELARYHFNRAVNNDPDNGMAYYYSGQLYYSYYTLHTDGEDKLKAYKKSEDYFEQAYETLKKNKEEIPDDLYYNLNNTRYIIAGEEKNNKMRQNELYDKALEGMLELRSNPVYRIHPAVEYLLGMIYYKKGFLDEAEQKLYNVTEYYQEELDGFIRNPKPLSVRQNKILYLNAIVYNNLGNIYNSMAIRNNDQNFIQKARIDFYKAMELGSRYNNTHILALSKLNLQDSIFQDNVRYIENFRVGNRETYLYDFTPKYLGEYE
ncbi:MAG: hypothetical protein A2Y41_09485 [Spirochaetes bacterium GWB1_36_13]|nr:MAG: hypothetical protein A2Y41_09485 [Spirochaetes bacterium GWB1_36_13]